MAFDKIYGTQFLDTLVSISKQVEKNRAKRIVGGKDKSAVLKTQKKFDLKSVTEYVQAIKQFKSVSKVEKGYFYTFTYKPDMKTKKSVLKFYDLQPLAFIYEGFKSNTGKVLWIGINFHRMPIIIRQRLVNALLTKYGIDTTKVHGNKRLLLANYKTMIPIVKKVTFAVRMYRNDRIFKNTLKRIPLSAIRQLIIFYPETLYKASIGELMAKYRTYAVGDVHNS